MVIPCMVRRAMVGASSGLGRRSILVLSLAAVAAGAAARAVVTRRTVGGSAAVLTHAAHELRTALPWRLVRNLIDSGKANARLGLVQAQHIYGKTGAAGGYALVRAGLVRVRIPASLARQGDHGWRHDRFEDGWWMERLRDIGVPFKAVDVLAEPEKRDAIKVFSKWPTIPQVYVGGKFIGGCDILREMHARGEFAPLVKKVIEAA